MNDKMKLLIVGGTFDDAVPKASGFVHKLFLALSSCPSLVTEMQNGGSYSQLPELLEKTKEYDAVIWMPNVSNVLPKIRDVKEVAPHTLLVTSKRNDGDKYSFQELVNRALGVKANLTIVIKKLDDAHFSMMLFDPLGNAWYNGDNIHELAKHLASRLVFLHGCTRQQTVRSYDFDPPAYRSYGQEAEQFVTLIKRYAGVFHDLIQPAKEVTRFLGNTSTGNFRCTRGGFPSYSFGNVVYMSRRNVDKETLSVEDFVPVSAFSADHEKIIYAGGNKPSVDTPVQVRLYNELPNIHYMIHAHVYCKDGDNLAPFTARPIPCGALEEVREVLSVIDTQYGNRKLTSYKINLIGHGCIVMGGALSDIDNVDFVARQFPENIFFSL